MRRAGANPNDLVHLAREIDIIHNKILAIDHTLQRAEDETAAELERIQDEINKAWDEESEQRKRTTVDYRYRRIERIEDRGVDLRFYDDYISEIPYANKLPGRKNDQRAEHYRADKRQPGKRITKVDYEVKQ